MKGLKDAHMSGASREVHRSSGRGASAVECVECKSLRIAPPARAPWVASARRMCQSNQAHIDAWAAHSRSLSSCTYLGLMLDTSCLFWLD